MKSKEISWEIGETVVEGTLTSPDKVGKYPGVVFVAGSGPTDRNWESPILPGANGSARLLAENLTPHGYITLRYDKRVAGPRAQQNLPFIAGKISLESHFEELKGAVSYLLSHSDVDPKKYLCLPAAKGLYLVDDYIENMLLTVLDFQMKNVSIEKAIANYRNNRKGEIRNIEGGK